MRERGYFADGRLMRVDLSGGSPQILAEAPAGSGASWNRAGDILFSPDGTGPLYRVHETGGARTQITSIDQEHRESGHRWPEFLPDGRHFLFFTDSNDRNIRGIYEGSLDTNEHKLVIASSFHGIYAEPGYLLFARDGDFLGAAAECRQPPQAMSPGAVRGVDQVVPIGRPGESANGAIVVRQTA